MSTDDYKNLYWSVIHKREEDKIEQLSNHIEMKNTLLNISSENIELNKRIDLLEQNYIDGTIIGLSEKFITIKCKYGEMSIHKSQLNNEMFGKNMNRQCKFKLKYHINKYQGKDLILL